MDLLPLAVQVLALAAGLVSTLTGPGKWKTWTSVTTVVLLTASVGISAYLTHEAQRERAQEARAQRDERARQGAEREQQALERSEQQGERERNRLEGERQAWRMARLQSQVRVAMAALGSKCSSGVRFSYDKNGFANGVVCQLGTAMGTSSLENRPAVAPASGQTALGVSPAALGATLLADRPSRAAPASQQER